MRLNFLTTMTVALQSAVLFLTVVTAASAQSNWTTDTRVLPGITNSARPAPQSQNAKGTLRLEAYLSAEPDTLGQRPIDRGLVWRIYTLGGQSQAAKLILTQRNPTPTLQLPPGRYAVNAAFGRAYLTEMIDVTVGKVTTRKFILNAGGLRVIVKIAGDRNLRNTKARYDVYSDERNQSGDRQRIIANARPGLITRLNSGIYHIVSRLGDANARVASEVAVEAGKLTEAIVSHEAARVTFKLVRRENGEALADTEWVIMTRAGDIVKETAGALPTHILAPGAYSVSAKRDGRLYTRTFEISSGDRAEIEVLRR